MVRTLTTLPIQTLGYNGDDAFVFYGGFAIDIYGDVDVDGTGQPWDYLDGWVHRKNGKTSTTFDWENSGTNATDDYYTNKLNPNPYPLESYLVIHQRLYF